MISGGPDGVKWDSGHCPVQDALGYSSQSVVYMRSSLIAGKSRLGQIDGVRMEVVCEVQANIFSVIDAKAGWD